VIYAFLFKILLVYIFSLNLSIVRGMVLSNKRFASLKIRWEFVKVNSAGVTIQWGEDILQPYRKILFSRTYLEQSGYSYGKESLNSYFTLFKNLTQNEL
jgi:hypothetical protein